VADQPNRSITSLNTSNIDLPAAYRQWSDRRLSRSEADIRIEGASRGDDYVVVA